MSTDTMPQDERGATSVEYAIMCTMITVVIAGSVATFGGGVTTLIASVLGVFP